MNNFAHRRKDALFILGLYTCAKFMTDVCNIKMQQR